MKYLFILLAFSAFVGCQKTPKAEELPARGLTAECKCGCKPACNCTPENHCRALGCNKR